MALVYAARRLVESNLGWFYVTRSTLGEGAGKERAININKDVFQAWFPGKPATNDAPENIVTRYLDGRASPPSEIVHDSRTIRKQGGGKNWRMAGDAIEGAFYDVRINDLMMMVFDQSTNTLSWMVVRAGGHRGRNVPSDEAQLHTDIEAMLGPDTGNMWLIPGPKAAEIIQRIGPVFPQARNLLMAQKALLEAWDAAIASAGFIASANVTNRLPISLETKRFVILTGLSGSGKTLLARLFAKWICASPQQYVLVPVGSNWTSNENILGYADALDATRYNKTAALELLLRATQYPDEPHFLILDEMNLSHVERYFSDFLSAIEAPKEPLRLHGDANVRDGVPPVIDGLPSNLFVIGTVNVDETTYMFSPKVLDRANVIEFRAAPGAMDAFLNNPAKAGETSLSGQGAAFGGEFVHRANASISAAEMPATVRSIFHPELMLLFELLARHELEFGFRTAFEILRYLSLKRGVEANLDINAETALLRQAYDEQVCQKVLPRLHGARKRLEPLLLELAAFCALPRSWTSSGAGDLDLIRAASADVVKAGDVPTTAPDGAFMPISFEKIVRLLDRVRRNGFASFAEA